MKRHNLLVVGTTLLAATMLAATAASTDPNLGQFSGTLMVTGVVVNGQFKPNPKCGQCHAQATVRQEQSGYVMDLQVENSGNKKPEAITLTGKSENGRLTFKNDRYDLSLADGKVVGKRVARMQGDIVLTSSQPASQPVRP